MTNERKICRRCERPVRILDEERVTFLCQKHGVLRWWQITHGDAGVAQGTERGTSKPTAAGSIPATGTT